MEKPFAMKGQRMQVFMSLALAALAFVVVAGDESQKDDLAKRVETLKGEVTRIRGLEFKGPVASGTYTRKELRDFFAKEIDKELSPEKAANMQKVYHKLGLLPENFDIRKALADLQSDMAAAFYDPETKKLYLITPDEGREKKPSELEADKLGAIYGVSMDDVYLIHELTHAAQDQNFDLLTLPLNGKNNDDLGASLHAIVEGEATIVMYQYLFKEKFDKFKGSIEAMLKFAIYSPEMKNYPAILREMLIFPYSEGYRFDMEVKAAGKGSWDALSRLYEDLPQSTEQILHPEKYISQRDYPCGIDLPKIPELAGNDWKEIERNVLGEFVIRVLLKEFSLKDIKKTAEGWDGDSLVAYENVKDHRTTLVLFSTWDSEQDAQEFFEAYRKILGAKYKKGEESGGTDDRVTVKLESGLCVLDRRKSDVLVIEDIPAATAENVRAAVWNGVKKTELKKVERVKAEKSEEKKSE